MKRGTFFFQIPTSRNDLEEIFEKADPIAVEDAPMFWLEQHRDLDDLRYVDNATWANLSQKEQTRYFKEIELLSEGGLIVDNDEGDGCVVHLYIERPSKGPSRAIRSTRGARGPSRKGLAIDWRNDRLVASLGRDVVDVLNRYASHKVHEVSWTRLRESLRGSRDALVTAKIKWAVNDGDMLGIRHNCPRWGVAVHASNHSRRGTFSLDLH
jgi:hypothetical protein